jgi:hypothetical protein
MSSFKLIKTNIDIQPFVDEIQKNQSSWYYDTKRQKIYGVHKATHSIPLRLHPEPKRDEFPGDIELVVNTPMARKFTSLLSFAHKTAEDLHGDLGRVLVTKLAARSYIGLHYDHGEYYKKRDRFHLVISHEGESGLRVKDEEQLLEIGTLWCFDNYDWHSAFNNGTGDRIHLVFDIKLQNPIFSAT